MIIYETKDWRIFTSFFNILQTTSYKRELKSEIHDFKTAGYDFAELTLGLSIKTGNTFED